MTVDLARVASACILIVDDQEANVTLLERLLKRAGFVNLMSTTDPLEVMDLRAKIQPDIVLLDLNMPELDGYQLLQELQPWIDNASGEFLPVLVLTADAAPKAKERALTLGAKDFLTKPFDPSEVVLRVKNLLETRYLHLELKQHNEQLEDRVRARTAEIWEAVNQLEQSQQELRQSREETVHRLSLAAEFRDDETARHIQRMSMYTELLARAAGWDEERAEVIRVASQMHDVGKIGTPDHILLKPRALTPVEREIMEKHAQIGYDILSGSNSTLLQLAATIALTHHERVDGTGYPNGLKGEDIPIEGRMSAIADVYDALSSDRVYRKAFSFIESINMMREARGSHFDPELLDLFLDSMDDVLKIKESHSDFKER